MLTLVNGQVASVLSVMDRGLMYGDGLFETVAMKNGALRFWTLHANRLLEGCRRLSIPPPDTGRLHDEAIRACADSASAVVRITITRGPGLRGYRPAETTETTRIVQALPWPDYSDRMTRDGVAVRWCRTRLALQPRLAGLKHLNRLEQVLARAEWQDEYAEGLMQDMSGRVIEGTMSNLFLAWRGTLITPDLSESGVAGVMRANILRMAQQLSIPHTVQDVTPAMVEEADELFLTNCLIGIWPVAQLEARHYVVAGTITQALQKALQSNG